MITKLDYQLVFPHPDEANEDGIVAYGGDLSPSRLYLAYREGIFPWYSVGDPILWWSPDPRLILHLDDFKLRPSLKKRMKHFEVRFDTAFTEVLQACASVHRPGQQGTWLQPELIEAMSVLHSLGKAHSVEAYYKGELVGGLYGVSVGAVFCGESMFAKKSDASKVAFAVLIGKLKEWGYAFVDAQVPTAHLKSLGAIEVYRDYFLKLLYENRDKEVSPDAWKGY
ncbi:leucyl/phenylalanyl-tRNA--protein transferase [Sulfurimonas sp. HSL3-7]|uniref:leucyl/phenylalanyl-tRNA--protein transferase n=1 Tax=Sulfonitrofixus jiaomeiensis TaxID=3131938 RepID=UPI0031F7D9DF